MVEQGGTDPFTLVSGLRSSLLGGGVVWIGRCLNVFISWWYQWRMS